MFTSMFMHAGLMHLLSNMWFLWLFGNNVEDRLGHVVYLFFYLVGGLAALACHWATNPSSPVPVVGASGAVAAVLGAYAITFPFAKVRTLVFLFVFVTIIDLPALMVLGFWFLGQLLEARHALNAGVDGGVAFMAHVGGFVAGLILMPLLGGTRPPPEEGDPRIIDADFYEPR
jgi:membrane associated rhomboid family serine protease